MEPADGSRKTRDAAEQCQLSSSDSEEGSVTIVTDSDSQEHQGERESGRKVSKTSDSTTTSTPAEQKNVAENNCGRVSSKSFYFERQRSMNFGDDNPVVLEAFNSELINLHSTNSIPDKPLSDLGPFASLDDYLLTVNQHKKFHRKREKLYFTQGPSKRSWIPQLRWCLILLSLSLLVLGCVGIIFGYTYFTHPKPQRINSFPESISGRPVIGTESSVFWQSSWSSSSTSPPPSYPYQSSDPPGAELHAEMTSSPRPVPDYSTEAEKSSFPPLISNNFVSSAADISFTITNAAFNDSLGDKESSAFREFATHVQNLITYELENFKGWRGVRARVFEFMPGSIVVKMRISWDDERKSFSDLRVVLSTLRQLGQFYILPSSSYGIFDLCKFQNHGCSHVCRFNYGLLDFQCVCPLEMSLSADLKSCEDKKMDKLQISSTESPQSDSLPEIPSVTESLEFPVPETTEKADDLSSQDALLTETPPPSSLDLDEISNTVPVTTLPTMTATHVTTAASSLPTATTTTTTATTTASASPPVPFPGESQQITHPGTHDAEPNKTAGGEREEGGVISPGMESNTAEPPENTSTGEAESYENSVTDYMLNIMERTENGYYSQIQGETQSPNYPTASPFFPLQTDRNPRLGFSNASRYSEEKNNAGNNAVTTSEEADSSTPSDELTLPGFDTGLSQSEASDRSSPQDTGPLPLANSRRDHEHQRQASELYPQMLQENSQSAQKPQARTTPPPESATTLSLAGDILVNQNMETEEMSAEPIAQTTESSLDQGTSSLA